MYQLSHASSIPGLAGPGGVESLLSGPLPADGVDPAVPGAIPFLQGDGAHESERASVSVREGGREGEREDVLV